MKHRVKPLPFPPQSTQWESVRVSDLEVGDIVQNNGVIEDIHDSGGTFKLRFADTLWIGPGRAYVNAKKGKSVNRS